MNPYIVLVVIALLVLLGIFYLRSLPKIIQPFHPDDKALLRISQGSIMSNTTLPSGFTVPADKLGRVWFVEGETLRLVDLHDVHKLRQKMFPSDPAKGA